MLCVGKGAYGVVQLYGPDKVKKSPLSAIDKSVGFAPDQVVELSTLNFLREKGLAYVAPVLHEVRFSETAPTADIIMQLGEVLVPSKAALPDFGRYVYGLFKRLQALHSVGMFHCDLKPSNVVVCDEGGVGTRTAHLIDWGFIKMREHLAFGIFDHGTLSCVAPEILLAKVPPFVDMEAAEIWSVAALVLQLFILREAGDATAKSCRDVYARMMYLPCSGYDHLAGIFALLGLPAKTANTFYGSAAAYNPDEYPRLPGVRRRQTYLHDMPPHLEELLFAMLELEPSKRITWDGVVAHPFMRHYDDFVMDAVPLRDVESYTPSIHPKYGVEFMQPVLQWCWSVVVTAGQQVLYSFVAEIVCNAIHRTGVLEFILADAPAQTASPLATTSSLEALAPPAMDVHVAAKQLAVAALSLAYKFYSTGYLEATRLAELFGRLISPAQVTALEGMLLGSAAMPSLCCLFRRALISRVTLEARRQQRNLVSDKLVLLCANYSIGMYPESFTHEKDVAAVLRAHDDVEGVDWPLAANAATHAKLAQKFRYR